MAEEQKKELNEFQKVIKAYLDKRASEDELLPKVMPKKASLSRVAATSLSQRSIRPVGKGLPMMKFSVWPFTIMMRIISAKSRLSMQGLLSTMKSN